MPVQLKEAIIRPKLKKESLDHEVYSNFRPISNLKFMSKMIEITDDVKYGKTEKCTRAADDVQTHSNIWTLFVLYTVHIPASYRFTVRICAGLGPIATFRLCFLFFLYLTCKLIRFVWTVFERLLLLKAEFSRSDDTRWPLLKISCSLEILKLS